MAPSDRASVLATRFLVLFSCLDQDGDDRLDERDLARIGERLRDERGWGDSDPSWLRIRAAVADFWLLLSLCVDADGSGDLSREEFTLFHRLMAEQTAEFGGQPPPWATALFGALLGALDADGDGRVQLDEYAAFLRAMGSRHDPARAFARLDRDGSGALDLEELAALLAAYLTDDDPDAPGAWLLTGGTGS